MGLLFDIAWSGYDAGAGIESFDVEYQVDDQAWNGWITDTLDTEATFVGETGHNKGGSISEWNSAWNGFVGRPVNVIYLPG
jgi:hypothetical protein